MRKLPENLNNRLTAISLISAGYATYELHTGGGGLIWELMLGLFGYLFLAGIWQAWVDRRK